MYKMETKTQTESILAKLMGLEEQRPNKKLHCGQLRVLSERYLQDIALICRRKKWSFDRFSTDMDDEMLDKNDSDEGILYSASSDDKIPLERNEKESHRILQKCRLLNSTQKAEKDYYLSSRGGGYSLKLFKSPNENDNIENSNHLQLSSSYSKGEKHKKRDRDFQRLRTEALGHGSLVRHGVAKQVAKKLQQSVWHNYSEEFRCKSTSDEVDNFTRNKIISNSSFVQTDSTSPLRNSNVGRLKFNVHKDWCLKLVNGGSSKCNSTEEVNSTAEVDLTPRSSNSIASLGSEDDASCEETPLISSDLNDFGKRDLFGVCLSDNKAIERVLDELPVMLQEIDSFRNRECKEFDALRRQVADEFLMPLHESNNKSPPYQLESNTMCPDPASKLNHISSTAHSNAVQGSEAKIQQPTKKDTKEARVMSYVVDVLAELGHHPLEDFTNLCVFDTLEKRHGKHSSWLRSERKLLFDRIKCGLYDIQSCTLYELRTKRRLLQLNQEIIKKELLDLLVSQQKEARRESIEEMVERDNDRLEFEEGVQIVAKEIGDALVKELVEEIVSI